MQQSGQATIVPNGQPLVLLALQSTNRGVHHQPTRKVCLKNRISLLRDQVAVPLLAYPWRIKSPTPHGTTKHTSSRLYLRDQISYPHGQTTIVAIPQPGCPSGSRSPTIVEQLRISYFCSLSLSLLPSPFSLLSSLFSLLSSLVSLVSSLLSF